MSTGRYIKYFIAAEYLPEQCETGTLWLIVTMPDDNYHSGDTVIYHGEEYVLGKRDIDDVTICSYELILKEDVLEL